MKLCDVAECGTAIMSGAAWCGIHAAVLEPQHARSHELDGHSHAIPGCPVCRDPDGWAKQAQPRARVGEDCPARGAGLKHAHWDECRGNHPGTDEYHAPQDCCHCGRPIGW